MHNPKSSITPTRGAQETLGNILKLESQVNVQPSIINKSNLIIKSIYTLTHMSLHSVLQAEMREGRT